MPLSMSMGRLSSLSSLSALLVAAGCGSGAPRVPAASVGLPDSVASPAGYRVPSDSLIPSGALGTSIRRGRAILIAGPARH